MNLFALTKNPTRRIVRIPLSAEVQKDVEALFTTQESDFYKFSEDQIAFDGKYKPENGESLFISDYDDIDSLHTAVSNPIGVPTISPENSAFESIKALFVGKIAHGKKLALLQNFDKRKILSNKGLSLFHSAEVYKKVEGVGLTLDNKLTAILEDTKLSFFSFFSARQIFDLSQYYKEATDDDIREFSENKSIHVSNVEQLLAVSDAWIRRKVALVMQSAILDKIDIQEAIITAESFGITLNTTEVNGHNVLILPDNKADLKKLLRFLDEDYFQSILLSTPHISNSKRQVPLSK